MRINSKLLNKLPKYAQQWKWVYLQEGYTGFGVDACCKAHKDDPNQVDVVFVCDNWEEFLWWVKKYKTEFRAQHRDID